MTMRFATAIAVLLLVAQAGAARQDGLPEPDAAIEDYLASRGLQELLAMRLKARLDAASGQERVQLANRLGDLYVELLDATATPEQRDAWERRAKDLLDAVPEAETYSLRINLAKARYLRAEEAAERVRMRAATPEEAQEAERVLRETAGEFRLIGQKVNRLVEALERREERGLDADTELLQRALGDARRNRSLAFYYAGWSNYYVAMLGDSKPTAEEALRDFGRLLNAVEGRPASVERLPESLIRYEHVARAAIGCALASSIMGQDEAALRWLDAVAGAGELPDAVKDQLPARRMVVLTAARRWADLDQLVRTRRSGPDRTTVPLSPAEARLLAVLMLEALASDAPRAHARDAVRLLADTALADLVTLGQVRHVIDIVNRYGTSPIGEEGFIVLYVRGLRTYEQARADHAAAGEDPEEPSASPAIANRYREAAGLLGSAAQSEDAGKFAEEAANAGLLRGLSLYYAGDLEQAANELEEVFRAASSLEQGEEALWLAVVAVTKAAEGTRPSLAPRRDELGALYLQSYPTTERAAKLLLRQATAGLIAEEEAVAILLRVDQESPLYEGARRHAAGLLYRIYRRAHGSDRDFAALRFTEVAVEVLAIDERTALDESDPGRNEAANNAVARIRQLLDACLSASAPDLSRAREAFGSLDRIVEARGFDTTDIAEEIAFRRLQFGLATDDEDMITAQIDALSRGRGEFARSAERLLYRHVYAQWTAQPADAFLARRVAQWGSRVIQQFAGQEGALKDAAIASLHDSVAAAAAAVWRAEKDEQMRDLAIQVDRALLAGVGPSATVLRRLGELSEAAGDTSGALECWRTLMAGYEPGAEPWFEARYESLRLLAASDPDDARQAIATHKVLYPNYGPDPWGGRIAALDTALAGASGPVPGGGP